MYRHIRIKTKMQKIWDRVIKNCSLFTDVSNVGIVANISEEKIFKQM